MLLLDSIIRQWLIKQFHAYWLLNCAYLLVIFFWLLLTGFLQKLLNYFLYEILLGLAMAQDFGDDSLFCYSFVDLGQLSNIAYH